MKWLLQYCIGVTIIGISCQDIEHDLSLDPASKAYVDPTGERYLIVTDFDADTIRNVWGWGHKTTEYGGGTVIPSFPYEFHYHRGAGYRKSRVLQLDYVASGSPNSGAAWFQILGTDDPRSDTLTFNPKVLRLRSLSFYARGNTGGEVLQVTCVDITKNGKTKPPVRVQLTDKWDKYPILLDDLAKPNVDFSKLIFLEIHVGANSTRGKVFIDEIAFEWTYP